MGSRGLSGRQWHPTRLTDQVACCAAQELAESELEAAKMQLQFKEEALQQRTHEVRAPAMHNTSWLRVYGLEEAPRNAAATQENSTLPR